eukprot:scaffold27802_cov28-Tisochrysis_lutea.AAC.4
MSTIQPQDKFLQIGSRCKERCKRIAENLARQGNKLKAEFSGECSARSNRGYLPRIQYFNGHARSAEERNGKRVREGWG